MKPARGSPGAEAGGAGDGAAGGVCWCLVAAEHIQEEEIQVQVCLFTKCLTPQPLLPRRNLCQPACAPRDLPLNLCVA